MTQQSRMLLILGLMAVFGVSALAFLANRYAKLAPLKSVADVERPASRWEAREPAGAPSPGNGESGAVDRAPATPAAGPAAVAPPSAETAAEAAPVAAGSAEAAAAVEAFVTVRTMVKEAIDSDPGMRRRMLQEASGQARHAPSRLHYRLFIDVRVAREKGFERTGASAESYDRVREDFVLWQEGGEPKDARLVAEFENNRERLDPLYLGDLEVLDQ